LYFRPRNEFIKITLPAGDSTSSIIAHTEWKGNLWFTNTYATNKLFFLDTLGQCHIAHDLTAYDVQANSEIAPFAGKIYFNGYTSDLGHELWEYDPILDTTLLYADIHSGSSSSDPMRFAAIHDRLYFVADDGIHGQEVWSIGNCFTLVLNTLPDTIGAQTGEIQAIVQGGTEPFSYQWSNGATTQNISGVSSGYYEVKVTDATGCEAVQFVLVNGVVDADELRVNKLRLKIYPNPANNMIFIEKMVNSEPEFQHVQLLSLAGQVFREIRLETDITQVNLDDLPSGIWLLSFGNGVVGKFVKI
jgi:ELWxxDGT repeat protein